MQGDCCLVIANCLMQKPAGWSLQKYVCQVVMSVVSLPRNTSTEWSHTSTGLQCCMVTWYLGGGQPARNSSLVSGPLTKPAWEPVHRPNTHRNRVTRKDLYSIAGCSELKLNAKTRLKAAERVKVGSGTGASHQIALLDCCAKVPANS